MVPFEISFSWYYLFKEESKTKSVMIRQISIRVYLILKADIAWQNRISFSRKLGWWIWAKILFVCQTLAGFTFTCCIQKNQNPICHSMFDNKKAFTNWILFTCCKCESVDYLQEKIFLHWEKWLKWIWNAYHLTSNQY